MKRNSNVQSVRCTNNRLPPLSPAAKKASGVSGKSKSVVQLHGYGGWYVLEDKQPQELGPLHNVTRCGLDRSAECYERRLSIDVGEMLNNSYSDEEVLSVWLERFGFKRYASNFLNAGYDVQTTSRMTPEDLTAIGITNPEHRKKITAELHRFRVADTWPSYQPGPVRAWLCEIGLGEYANGFESQGCRTVDDLQMLGWEDFEEMGVKKLGHLKRLMLASKKLKVTRKENAATMGQSSASSVRATAEIRPFSHVSYGHSLSPGRSGSLTDSCSSLKTFRSSPHRRLSCQKQVQRVMADRSGTDDGHSSDTSILASPANPRRSMAVVHPVRQEKLLNGSCQSAVGIREMSKSQELSSFNSGPACSLGGEYVPLSARYPSSEKKRSQSTSAAPSPAAPIPLFRLSSHWECNADGQAFPAEELPPPPTLLCEASIKALRNIRRNPPKQAKSTRLDEYDDRSSVSMLGGTMSRSMGSMSIEADQRQRSVASSPDFRRKVPPALPSSVRRASTSSRVRSVEGLDDIENMLQNLSDQLDALLVHPAA